LMLLWEFQSFPFHCGQKWFCLKVQLCTKPFSISVKQTESLCCHKNSYCTYKLDCSLNFIAEHWIKTGDQNIQRVPEVIFCFLKKIKCTISHPQ